MEATPKEVEIYETLDSKRPFVVIILCGGNKNPQDKDIIEAQEYWENYRRS